MASSQNMKKAWEWLSIKNLCCCLAVMVSILLFEGCKKQDVPQPVNPESDAPVEGKMSMNTDKEFSSSYGNLPWRTVLQLQEARTATAKYRNIHKAIEDGYQDINVVVQNMGFHYMKSTLADAVFEIRKPELLVYNNNEGGVPELVAVEYAVPISITPDKARKVLPAILMYGNETHLLVCGSCMHGYGVTILLAYFTIQTHGYSCIKI